MADDDKAEMQALARDWITLVQSELSALAADREAQETWRALIGLWAAAATAVVNAVPKPHDPAPPAPRPAPAPAASDARDDEIRRLAERVAELERRLGGENPRKRR